MFCYKIIQITIIISMNHCYYKYDSSTNNFKLITDYIWYINNMYIIKYKISYKVHNIHIYINTCNIM